MTITTIREAPGRFAVLWEGRPTDWSIVNGDLGTSGHAPNVYGIARHRDGATVSVRWIGTLAACKKALALAGKAGRLARPAGE